MRLPGELDELVLPVGQALAEVYGCQIMFLQHATGCQIDHPQTGLPAQTGRLVQHTVHDHQSLRERIRVVGIQADNAIALHWNCVGRGQNPRLGKQTDEEQNKEWKLSAIGKGVQDRLCEA